MAKTQILKAQFKFDKSPPGVVVVDTTSSSSKYSGLSPFVLSAPPAVRFENLWQFSKVYEHQWDEILKKPNKYWHEWRDSGYSNLRAYRYPMGKSRVPVCSWWDGVALDYIEARKQIYMPEYAKNVIKTDSYKKLLDLYAFGVDIVLLDYDAYDHEALGMTLIDVANNRERKMGHAFVLLMLLTGQLKACLESKTEVLHDRHFGP